MRDEVLSAGQESLGNVGFLRRLADDDERHRAGSLLLDLGDLADRHRQAIGEEAKQLGRVAVHRAGERIDLRDPIATDGMAAVAQRAIDELDVVFAAAEHDERDGGLRHLVVVLGRELQFKQGYPRSEGRGSQSEQRLTALRDDGFT